MTEYASAEDLTAGDLGDGEDFNLPSGRTIRVRGLSRHELFFHGRGATDAKGVSDSALIERRNVAACLVEPKMTVAQVEAWQRNSLAGGDFSALTTRIRDLSQLGEGADKSDVRADGVES